MGDLNIRRIATMGLAALLLSACAGSGEFRQVMAPVDAPPDPVSAKMRMFLGNNDLLVFTHAMPEVKVMQPVVSASSGVVEAASELNDGNAPSLATPPGWWAWMRGLATGPVEAAAIPSDMAKGRGTAWYVLSDPQIPSKLSARFTRELRGEGLRAKRIHSDSVVSRKDMVMLVEVEHLALEGDESQLNPEYRLRIWGHAALVGASRHVLKDRSFDYMSEDRLRLSEWTGEDGARLSAELDAALKDIARQVTGSMFAPVPMQPDAEVTPEG